MERERERERERETGSQWEDRGRKEVTRPYPMFAYARRWSAISMMSVATASAKLRS